MAERTRIGMPLADFLAQFDNEPFELIAGERIPVTPAKKAHSKISKRLYDRILFYLAENELGEVFFETAFILEDKTDWVRGARVPDVCFYEQSRYDEHEAQNPDDAGKPFILVPDFVIEVISPTDKYSEVNIKVDAYLRDGVRLIWIVDPQRKTVTVYQGEDNMTTLRGDDALMAGDVLPNFSLVVHDIFST